MSRIKNTLKQSFSRILRIKPVNGSNFIKKTKQLIINDNFVKIKNIQALNFNKNFGFEIFKDDEEYCYLKLSKEVWENSKKSRLLKPIKRYLDKIEYYFE